MTARGNFAGNRGGHLYTQEEQLAIQKPDTSMQAQEHNLFVNQPEKNKSANFGYSKTHPVLISPHEESKVGTQTRGPLPRKPVTPVQTPGGNTHIFDPSKAVNEPPPKVSVGRHHPGEYKNVPKPPNYSQFNDPTQGSYDQPVFTPQTPNPEPVIAATKVKPPTAQMKPKGRVPTQRYAPPPRLQGKHSPEGDKFQPLSHEFEQPSMPGGYASGPSTTTRGRGPPPARGRGMPAPPRGGHPLSGRGGMGVGQPPAPMPTGGMSSPPGGQAPPMNPVTVAPPPPKMGRRPKPPTME